MARTTIGDLFTKIQQAMDALLVSPGHVTMARCFHGPAEDAVYEHLVALRKNERASVVFGLDPTVTVSEDAALNLSIVGFPCTFTVLVARSKDIDADNARLSGLYEQVVDVFSAYRTDYGPAFFGAENIIYRGVRLALPSSDYLALGGTAEFHVHHVPYTNE